MIPSGIEHANSRFVEQCFSQLYSRYSDSLRAWESRAQVESGLVRSQPDIASQDNLSN